jgi:hypothetical protein
MGKRMNNIPTTIHIPLQQDVEGMPNEVKVINGIALEFEVARLVQRDWKYRYWFLGWLLAKVVYAHGFAWAMRGIEDFIKADDKQRNARVPSLKNHDGIRKFYGAVREEMEIDTE